MFGRAKRHSSHTQTNTLKETTHTSLLIVTTHRTYGSQSQSCNHMMLTGARVCVFRVLAAPNGDRSPQFWRAQIKGMVEGEGGMDGVIARHTTQKHAHTNKLTSVISFTHTHQVLADILLCLFRLLVAALQRVDRLLERLHQFGGALL